MVWRPLNQFKRRSSSNLSKAWTPPSPHSSYPGSSPQQRIPNPVRPQPIVKEGVFYGYCHLHTFSRFHEAEAKLARIRAVRGFEGTKRTKKILRKI